MIGGFETHPAADLFPMMEEAAFAELVADMKEHGLRLPIVRWWSTRPDGTRQQQILDGRNRLRACSDARVTPRFTDVDDATVPDPYAYAISANLARRHLTEAQRAMIAARVYEVYAERAKGRMLKGKGDPGANLPQGSERGPRARDEAAAALGVGARSVDHARAVQASGDENLIGMVDAGQVAVSAAAEVARLPAEEREATVAAGPSAVKAKAKEQREHKGKQLTAGDHAAMRALAGTWPREKLAERFRVDAAEVDRILDAPAPEQEGPAARAEALSQFFTPPWLAAKMVELAGLRAGDTVLEPSGGRGALVRAVLDACPTAEVIVHELDPRMVAELLTIEGVQCVQQGSYLEHEFDGCRFDVAIENPPYEDGLDGEFIAKTCREACTVVALVRANVFYSRSRWELVWSQYGKHLTAFRFVVMRPDFTEGEKGVPGAKSDFVVIRLDDLGEDVSGTASPTVDWWLEPEGDA